jgi:hypothetical protein
VKNGRFGSCTLSFVQGMALAVPHTTEKEPGLSAPADENRWQLLVIDPP